MSCRIRVLCRSAETHTVELDMGSAQSYLDVRRPVFTVLEILLEEYKDPNWRGMDRPLEQMVNDWHSLPDSREQPLSSIPPADADSGHIVKIAAVLHALCNHNGVQAPRWVHEHRSEENIWLFGVKPWMGTARRIMDNAAPECKEHRVWFELRTVQSKKEYLENPFAHMSIEESSGMLGLNSFVGQRSDMADKCIEIFDDNGIGPGDLPDYRDSGAEGPTAHVIARDRWRGR